ncbi:MAG: Holliday junction resolvase RecU, partial [Mycoplasmatales bacterium]|nr:Holliday junction resolvase RecU [Mycoplasmatales bacterium]
SKFKSIIFFVLGCKGKTIQVLSISAIWTKELKISFKKIDNSNGKLNIKDGYIKSKSTTDYYGVSDGKFYSFEAKSTNSHSFPISNIKKHQLDYLYKIKKNGGKAFFIIYFSKYNKFFIIFPETISNLIKKSLSIEIAFKEGIEIDLVYPGILDFLVI